MLFNNSYHESEYYKTIEAVDRDDRLLCVIKQHPFGILFVYAGAFIAFIIALFMVSIFLPTSENTANTFYSIATLLAFIAGLILIFILLALTYIYNQSSLTITDNNVVRVMQKSLYDRKVSHVSLGNIEDVSSEQRGVFANMFNFGTITVETAGDQVNFVFNNCPHPNRVAKIILDAKADYLSRKGQVGSVRNDRQLNKN